MRDQHLQLLAFGLHVLALALCRAGQQIEALGQGSLERRQALALRFRLVAYLVKRSVLCRLLVHDAHVLLETFHLRCDLVLEHIDLCKLVLAQLEVVLQSCLWRRPTPSVTWAWQCMYDT